jgi:4-hydroxythreonine-4-phosphate dehydrogenase
MGNVPVPEAPIALSAGEPAGVGPDLCLSAACAPWPARLVVYGDRDLLAERARVLGLSVQLVPYAPAHGRAPHAPGRLEVVHVPLARAVRAGAPDPANAQAVVDGLRVAAKACMSGEHGALVTAPVHKGVINDAGIDFTGHTELLARLAGARTAVMLLCGGGLRVALATTHLPLARVSAALTRDLLGRVLAVLHADLERRFGLPAPRILVCGLNPHAGEGGHLGREEIDVIAPVIAELGSRGLRLEGPVPADTAFTAQRLAGADAVLAMYHDQGLPVLKHAAFGRAVNVTLGLPFVRTSVDHGTALEVAGSGRAETGSMEAAIALAAELAQRG